MTNILVIPLLYSSIGFLQCYEGVGPFPIVAPPISYIWCDLSQKVWSREKFDLGAKLHENWSPLVTIPEKDWWNKSECTSSDCREQFFMKVSAYSAVS